MQQIDLNHLCLQGAVSVERTASGMKPWRIPYYDKALFVPDALNGKAEAAAGVRIAIESNTSFVTVQFTPNEEDMVMDCVIQGTLYATVRVPSGEGRLTFSSLPPGKKRIDIYLPPTRPVCITGLWIDKTAQYGVPLDHRPKWIAYGSSITQAEAAESPSQTWTALVARRMNWNFTCLGYSANCHMEPMVARMIRDMDADFISLCLGINIMGGSSYSLRTFRAGIIGFVQTIRDRHPDIPLIVQSPIYSREREVQPNKVDLTLPLIRQEVYEAIRLLNQAGDVHLYYVHGLDIIGEADAAYLPDLLHPDADGYKLMAERFEQAIKQFPGVSNLMDREE